MTIPFREPETQNAPQVVPWKIDLFYDLLLNQFAVPENPRAPARRTSIPSTKLPIPWFTNRILARPVSIEEAVRGPLTTNGPAPGEW